MSKRPDRSPVSFRQKTLILREAEIARAARALLYSRGCRLLRVEDVAAACGVAKGICYQHFQSRTDLITAVVRSLDEALATRVSATNEADSDPREQLRNALLMAVDMKLATLAQRHTPKATHSAEQLGAETWPCCMEVTSCPYGGARETTRALERLGELLPHTTNYWAGALVSALLALPQCLSVRNPERVDPPAIRALMAEFFDRLVPGDTRAER